MTTNAATVPGHISVSHMLRMGFTPRIIWHLLGPPHTSRTQKPFPKWPQHHFYREDAVEKLTLTKEFQLNRLWETLKFRQASKAQETVLEFITNWAENVPITTHFPETTLEEIIPIAVQERTQWGHLSIYTYTDPNTPRELRELWAYTYLKHSRTNYDELCEELRDHHFGRYAYPLILHRVNKLILDHYPFTIRLRGDNGLAIKRCRTCGREERGEYNGHYWTKPKHWYTRARNNASNAIHNYCSRACAMPQLPKPLRVRRPTKDPHPWTTTSSSMPSSLSR